MCALTSPIIRLSWAASLVSLHSHLLGMQLRSLIMTDLSIGMLWKSSYMDTLRQHTRGNCFIQVLVNLPFSESTCVHDIITHEKGGYYVLRGHRHVSSSFSPSRQLTRASIACQKDAKAAFKIGRKLLLEKFNISLSYETVKCYKSRVVFHHKLQRQYGGFNTISYSSYALPTNTTFNWASKSRHTAYFVTSPTSPTSLAGDRTGNLEHEGKRGGRWGHPFVVCLACQLHNLLIDKIADSFFG